MRGKIWRREEEEVNEKWRAVVDSCIGGCTTSKRDIIGELRTSVYELVARTSSYSIRNTTRMHTLESR